MTTGLLIFGIVILIASGLFIWGKNKYLPSTEALTPDRYSRIETQRKDITSYLPINKIEDNHVIINDNKFLSILEIEPFNLGIRGTSEQMDFQIRLDDFFKMIPEGQMITHTTNIDMDSMLNDLSQSVEIRTQENPLVEEYGNEYYERMALIPVDTRMEDNIKKVKKYYIVLSYDASPVERTQEASEKKSNMIMGIDNLIGSASVILAGRKLENHILGEKELYELYADYFNRGQKIDSDALVEKSFDETPISIFPDGSIELNAADRIRAILGQASDNILNVPGELTPKQQQQKNALGETIKKFYNEVGKRFDE